MHQRKDEDSDVKSTPHQQQLSSLNGTTGIKRKRQRWIRLLTILALFLCATGPLFMIVTLTHQTSAAAITTTETSTTQGVTLAVADNGSPKQLIINNISATVPFSGTIPSQKDYEQGLSLLTKDELTQEVVFLTDLNGETSVPPPRIGSVRGEGEGRATGRSSPNNNGHRQMHHISTFSPPRTNASLPPPFPTLLLLSSPQPSFCDDNSQKIEADIAWSAAWMIHGAANSKGSLSWVATMDERKAQPLPPPHSSKNDNQKGGYNENRKGQQALEGGAVVSRNKKGLLSPSSLLAAISTQNQHKMASAFIADIVALDTRYVQMGTEELSRILRISLPSFDKMNKLSQSRGDRRNDGSNTSEALSSPAAVRSQEEDLLFTRKCHDYPMLQYRRRRLEVFLRHLQPLVPDLVHLLPINDGIIKRFTKSKKDNPEKTPLSSSPSSPFFESYTNMVKVIPSSSSSLLSPYSSSSAALLTNSTFSSSPSDLSSSRPHSTPSLDFLPSARIRESTPTHLAFMDKRWFWDELFEVRGYDHETTLIEKLLLEKSRRRRRRSRSKDEEEKINSNKKEQEAETETELMKEEEGKEGEKAVWCDPRRKETYWEHAFDFNGNNKNANGGVGGGGGGENANTRRIRMSKLVSPHYMWYGWRQNAETREDDEKLEGRKKGLKKQNNSSKVFSSSSSLSLFSRSASAASLRRIQQREINRILMRKVLPLSCYTAAEKEKDEQEAWAQQKVKRAEGTNNVSEFELGLEIEVEDRDDGDKHVFLAQRKAPTPFCSPVAAVRKRLFEPAATAATTDYNNSAKGGTSNSDSHQRTFRKGKGKGEQQAQHQQHKQYQPPTVTEVISVVDLFKQAFIANECSQSALRRTNLHALEYAHRAGANTNGDDENQIVVFATPQAVYDVAIPSLQVGFFAVKQVTTSNPPSLLHPSSSLLSSPSSSSSSPSAAAFTTPFPASSASSPSLFSLRTRQYCESVCRSLVLKHESAKKRSKIHTCKRGAGDEKEVQDDDNDDDDSAHTDTGGGGGGGGLEWACAGYRVSFLDSEDENNIFTSEENKNRPTGKKLQEKGVRSEGSRASSSHKNTLQNTLNSTNTKDLVGDDCEGGGGDEGSGGGDSADTEDYDDGDDSDLKGVGGQHNILLRNDGDEDGNASHLHVQEAVEETSVEEKGGNGKKAKEVLKEADAALLDGNNITNRTRHNNNKTIDDDDTGSNSNDILLGDGGVRGKPKLRRRRKKQCVRHSASTTSVDGQNPPPRPRLNDQDRDNDDTQESVVFTGLCEFFSVRSLSAMGWLGGYAPGGGVTLVRSFDTNHNGVGDDDDDNNKNDGDGTLITNHRKNTNDTAKRRNYDVDGKGNGGDVVGIFKARTRNNSTRSIHIDGNNETNEKKKKPPESEEKAFVSGEKENEEEAPRSFSSSFPSLLESLRRVPPLPYESSIAYDVRMAVTATATAAVAATARKSTQSQFDENTPPSNHDREEISTSSIKKKWRRRRRRRIKSSSLFSLQHHHLLSRLVCFGVITNERFLGSRIIPMLDTWLKRWDSYLLFEDYHAHRQFDDDNKCDADANVGKERSSGGGDVFNSRWMSDASRRHSSAHPLDENGFPRPIKESKTHVYEGDEVLQNFLSLPAMEKVARDRSIMERKDKVTARNKKANSDESGHQQGERQKDDTHPPHTQKQSSVVVNYLAAERIDVAARLGLIGGRRSGSRKGDTFKMYDVPSTASSSSLAASAALSLAALMRFFVWSTLNAVFGHGDHSQWIGAHMLLNSVPQHLETYNGNNNNNNNTNWNEQEEEKSKGPTTLPSALGASSRLIALLRSENFFSGTDVGNNDESASGSEEHTCLRMRKRLAAALARRVCTITSPLLEAKRQQQQQQHEKSTVRGVKDETTQSSSTTASSSSSSYSFSFCILADLLEQKQNSSSLRTFYATLVERYERIEEKVKVAQSSRWDDGHDHSYQHNLPSYEHMLLSVSGGPREERAGRLVTPGTKIKMADSPFFSTSFSSFLNKSNTHASFSSSSFSSSSFSFSSYAPFNDASSSSTSHNQSQGVNRRLLYPSHVCGPTYTTENGDRRPLPPSLFSRKEAGVRVRGDEPCTMPLGFIRPLFTAEPRVNGNLQIHGRGGAWKNYPLLLLMLRAETADDEMKTKLLEEIICRRLKAMSSPNATSDGSNTLGDGSTSSSKDFEQMLKSHEGLLSAQETLFFTRRQFFVIVDDDAYFIHRNLVIFLTYFVPQNLFMSGSTLATHATGAADFPSSSSSYLFRSRKSIEGEEEKKRGESFHDEEKGLSPTIQIETTTPMMRKATKRKQRQQQQDIFNIDPPRALRGKRSLPLFTGDMHQILRDPRNAFRIIHGGAGVFMNRETAFKMQKVILEPDVIDYYEDWRNLEKALRRRSLPQMQSEEQQGEKGGEPASNEENERGRESDGKAYSSADSVIKITLTTLFPDDYSPESGNNEFHAFDRDRTDLTILAALTRFYQSEFAASLGQSYVYSTTTHPHSLQQDQHATSADTTAHYPLSRVGRTNPQRSDSLSTDGYHPPPAPPREETFYSSSSASASMRFLNLSSGICAHPRHQAMTIYGDIWVGVCATRLAHIEPISNNLFSYMTPFTSYWVSEKFKPATSPRWDTFLTSGSESRSSYSSARSTFQPYQSGNVRKEKEKYSELFSVGGVGGGSSKFPLSFHNIRNARGFYELHRREIQFDRHLVALSSQKYFTCGPSSASSVSSSPLSHSSYQPPNNQTVDVNQTKRESGAELEPVPHVPVTNMWHVHQRGVCRPKFPSIDQELRIFLSHQFNEHSARGNHQATNINGSSIAAKKQQIVASGMSEEPAHLPRKYTDHIPFPWSFIASYPRNRNDVAGYIFKKYTDKHKIEFDKSLSFEQKRGVFFRHMNRNAAFRALVHRWFQLGVTAKDED